MPAFQWLPVDDSDVRWSVRATDPRNGDDLSRDDVMAPDAEEAARKVAEDLMADTGLDFDVVAEWVDPAERLRRSA
jgi:hypothetical protein